MKKIALALVFLCLAQASISASGYADVAFNAGAFWPEDPVVRDHFDRDFFLQGHFGFTDESGVWEVRGNLGHYSNLSHYPSEVGNGLTINVVPLTASLIFNPLGKNSFLQPYIGGGAGGYFYNVSDDIYGQLDSGTKFGFHALAGLRVNIMENMYLSAEYQKHFVPPIYALDSQSFNNSNVTVGIGFYIPLVLPNRSAEYSQHDQDLLSQMQDITTEIKEMKTKRDQIEKQIDAFYDQDIEQSTGLLASVDGGQKADGRHIKITSPTSQQIIAEGTVSLSEVKDQTVHLVVKNDKGWSLDLNINRSPFSVSIGQALYPDFNAANADQWIVVSAGATATDSPEFAKQLRKINYLEGKMKDLDRRITDAQNHLNQLESQWQAEHPNVAVEQAEVVYVRSGYYRPYGGGPYVRRYYHPREFNGGPSYVPSTPPSTAERQAYAAQKKARLDQLRKEK